MAEVFILNYLLCFCNFYFKKHPAKIVKSILNDFDETTVVTIAR